MQTRWLFVPLLFTALYGCDTASTPTPETRITEIVEGLTWLTADKTIGPVVDQALRNLRARPDGREWNRTVSQLVKFGNRTGDSGFYSAAEIALGGLALTSSDAGDVASATASVHQAMHRFEDALQAAGVAVAERGLARDYGLLGDILLERGDYEGSANAYQSMVDLKPDALAYARAGNYRLATGDLRGAYQLLTIAQRGIGRGQDEAYAWVLGRIAWCELLLGYYDSGLHKAEQAAQIWPSPKHQLLLARARLTTGALEQSLDALDKLTAQYPDSLALWLQSELLDLVDQPEQAAVIRHRLRVMRNPPDGRGHAAYLLAHDLRRDLTETLLAAESEERQDSQTLALVALHAVREGRSKAADEILTELGNLEPQAALFAASAAYARRLFSRAETWLETADRGRLMLPPSQSSLLHQLRRQLEAARSDERVASL